ncbi:MAG: hypothetical protein ACI4XN_12475 [Candidatus Kurthia intestinigallinarum]
MNIYSEMSPNQISAEKEYLLSAIYKLLPYKEEHYEYLDNYFESVLQRLIGFNKISGSQPEVITIISLIEYARKENDFSKYRKAILDSCGLVKLIKESDAHD